MRLYFTKSFLQKEKCLEEAVWAIHLHDVKMDTQECAQEIYAHAWAYYHIPFRWIKDHARPVDLKDGGDTRFRKLIYRMIWVLA